MPKLKHVKELDEESQEQLESQNVSTYKPTDEEDELRIEIYDRFKSMRDSDERTEQETEWDLADKDYMAWVEPLDDDDYRTNINKPIAFSIIETELQETIERTSRPLVKPREFSDIGGAKLTNDVLKFSFDVGNFDLQYYLAKKEALTYGTGFLMEYYRIDKRNVKVPVKSSLDEEGNYKEEYELKQKVDFDDCYAEFVPIRHIYLDPAANHISKCRDMIWREILNVKEAKRKYGSRPGFINLEFVTAAGDTNVASFYERPKDINEGFEVEILHYYNRATDEYNVLMGDVIVRKGPLPFPHKELPVIPYYCYKRTNALYGLGIPKITRPMVEERNTMSNLRLDTQKMALSKMFFYDEMIELEDIDLITRPHGGIPVNTQGRDIRQVVNWIEYGDVKPSTYREEEILIEDIRRTTGIDDRVQGLNVGGTATEAAILKESSMKRINSKMRLNEMDGMVRLGKLRLENIRFYYPIPKIERIVKENGESEYKKKFREIRIEGRQYSFDKEGNLTHEDNEDTSFLRLDKSTSKYLQMDYDITYDASTVTPLSKPLQQQKTNEMFDRLTANPATAQEVDGRKAAHQLLRINDEDPELWLKKASVDVADMQLHAEMENTVMNTGNPLPPTPGATPEHTQIHLYHTKSSTFEQLPPEIQDVFEAHIAGEAGGQGVEMGAPSPNMTSQLPPPGMGMGDVVPTA